MADKVDVLVAKLPSPKQMLVRAQTGHRIILEAARDGRRVARPIFASEVRGFATARGTLLNWRAIEATGVDGIYALTERGHELLNLLAERARIGGAA